MIIQYRAATVADARAIAPMNAQLIRDEGHRNSMTVTQLSERMSTWLAGEYKAYLFERESKAVGYALYRIDPEHVYLRQLYIQPGLRRRGIGRSALEWLRRNAWSGHTRVRIAVPVGNSPGILFWRSVGVADYCLTMERPV